METIEEYEITEQPLPFRVENDEQAAWAMRKLKAKCDKIDENNNIASVEKLRIQSWLDSVNSALARDAAYFESLLLDYMRRERENDRKSIKLPHGVVKSVATQEKIVPQDGFVEWALANGRDDLLTFPEPKPNLAAIKQANNLELVDVVPAGVSFSVKVDK